MELLEWYNLSRTAGYYALAVLGPLLQLALALAVWREARQQPAVLLPAWLWAAATLLSGWPALALYWAAHHFAWGERRAGPLNVLPPSARRRPVPLKVAPATRGRAA